MNRPPGPHRGAGGANRPRGSESEGRGLAFEAIRAWSRRGVFIGKVLDDQFAEHRPGPQDRRLATELASETVRRQATLDSILARYVSRPRDQVDETVWLLLRLGVCQLVCLRHIPAHAAVDETVRLCDRLGYVKAKGFINGVLRSIERDLLPEEPTPSISLTDLASALLPIADAKSSGMEFRKVRFRRAIFAAPQPDPTEHLAQICSLPVWLLQRWSAQGMDHDSQLRTGLWFTLPGRMSLRVNLLQTTREKAIDVLQAAGVEVKNGSLPEALNVIGSVNVADLPGFREGWFSVQDESAMSATELLAPQPGERILDLCAAPGGKTTHLAERIKNAGTVVACDISEERLQSVRENASRLRLDCIQPSVIGTDGTGIPDGPYDAVLVDVPCSNTGVLGKRPEARWRLSPSSFDELISLQRRLLGTALSQVRPGGRVVYSTCSIDRDENRQVVDDVLAEQRGYRLAREVSHQPGSPDDGGYQALILREENVGSRH